MLHLQNNPDLDEFPMNNLTTCTQIARCEVTYYKIRHTNPVLADVEMELYHSLPSVQILLGEMTRLKSEAMRLEASDNTNATNTIAENCTEKDTRIGTTSSSTTTTEIPHTMVSPTPKKTHTKINMNTNNQIPNNNTTTTAATPPPTTTTTSTTVIPNLKPTADRQQSQNSTRKDTTCETETNNNNNNNTNDNQVKADDNHISGLSGHLLEQQKTAAEVERWESERTEVSI